MQRVGAPSSAVTRETHPETADYGFVRGARSVAPVPPGGAAAWFCSPRSVSPGGLTPLLDDDNTGSFRIAPGTDSSDEGGS